MNPIEFQCKDDSRYYLYADADVREVIFSIEGYGFNGFEQLALSLDYRQVVTLRDYLTDFIERNQKV